MSTQTMLAMFICAAVATPSKAIPADDPVSRQALSFDSGAPSVGSILEGVREAVQQQGDIEAAASSQPAPLPVVSAEAEPPACIDAADPACNPLYLSLALRTIERLKLYEATLGRMGDGWAGFESALRRIRRDDAAEFAALQHLNLLLGSAQEAVPVEADIKELFGKLQQVPVHQRTIPLDVRRELRERLVKHLTADKATFRKLVSRAKHMLDGWPRGDQYDSPNIIGGMITIMERGLYDP